MALRVICIFLPAPPTCEEHRYVSISPQVRQAKQTYVRSAFMYIQGTSSSQVEVGHFCGKSLCHL